MSVLLRSYMVNLLHDLWGAIPAVILLVLHHFPGVPLWFFWVALAGWLVIVGTMTVLMHLIDSQPCLTQKQNSDPCSKKGYGSSDMKR